MTQHLMTEASVSSQMDAVLNEYFVITCTAVSCIVPVFATPVSSQAADVAKLLPLNKRPVTHSATWNMAVYSPNRNPSRTVILTLN